MACSLMEKAAEVVETVVLFVQLLRCTKRKTCFVFELRTLPGEVSLVNSLNVGRSGKPKAAVVGKESVRRALLWKRWLWELQCFAKEFLKPSWILQH